MNDHIEKKLRSEKEIMSTWGDCDSPLVSIVCHTFEQERYIEDALASFLMQRTTFSFEIVIHDDASKDKTKEIIEGYRRQYPNIIFPILQTENQYSKNKKPSLFTFRAARGKYIALCEGDDYWIDTNKLARQVSVFKENPAVSLCFHPAKKYDVVNNSSSIMSKHFAHDTKVSLKEVILGRGHFMPTASLMFINEDIENLIESFKLAPVGDYFIQVYMSSLKGAYYINTPMSAYRKNSEGSWSANLHLEAESQIKHKILMIKPIAKFSEYLKIHNCNKYFEEVIAIYFVSATGLCHGVKNTLRLYIVLMLLVLQQNSLSRLSILLRVLRRLLLNKITRIKNVLSVEK
ncbi:MAG: glycosyltransferase [Gammaproteobacteria bacterium]|jgi:glycosyltransferase involved in cell wall biosynthesis|nr:glycosyltransferase [Gammaproteobacteria bacterium]